METISTYTSKQAEEDGILFDITKLNPAWKKGIFNFVTTNLMSEGYFEKDGNARTVNVVDLLNQANQIVRKASDNFKNFDSFFSGTIELPSGKAQEIFIGQNETGKFTIMLPEDY
jgi:Golgi nucleoside diphosphatase